MDKATAEEAYSLIGGRIILLLLLKNSLRVKTFERMYLALFQRTSQFSSFFAEARSALLRVAQAQLTDAGLLPPGPSHQVGSQLIKKLLANTSMVEIEYYKLLGYTVGYQLFEANIIAHQIESERVIFHSQLIRRFCELYQNRRR